MSQKLARSCMRRRGPQASKTRSTPGLPEAPLAFPRSIRLRRLLLMGL